MTKKTILLTLSENQEEQLKKIAEWEERTMEGVILFVIKNHINAYSAPANKE